MYRQRSFGNLRQSRELSSARSIIGRLFPTEADDHHSKVFNMNDTRKDILRNHSKVFDRSQKESQLFEKGVRKIQLQLTEKEERSSSRRYRNEAKFHVDPKLSKEPIQQPTGVRKITLSSKPDKASSRKHIRPPTEVSCEDSSQNFVVSRVNVSSNHKEQKQVIIKIGRNKASEIEYKPPPPVKEILNERKHFQQHEEGVRDLLTDRSTKGQMNFGQDFYKRSERMPTEGPAREMKRLFGDRGCMSSRFMR